MSSKLINFASQIKYDINRDLPSFYYQRITRELNRNYNSRHTEIRTLLGQNKENGGKFSMTIDTWIALNQDAYQVVTIYFIDNEWKFNPRPLSFDYLNERYSGTYLYQVLINSLRELFNIEDNIFSIIYDNASSNEKLFSLFKEEYVRKCNKNNTLFLAIKLHYFINELEDQSSGSTETVNRLYTYSSNSCQ